MIYHSHYNGEFRCQKQTLAERKKSLKMGDKLEEDHYDFTDDGKASIGEASYGHAAVNVTKDAGSFGAFSVNLEYADIDSSNALGSVSSDDPKFWLGWTKSF